MSALAKAFKALCKLLAAPFVFAWKILCDWCAGRLPTWASWTLEIVSVLFVAGLLGLLNWYLGLDQYLIGPLALRKVWLGLLFLLAYLTVRLFYFFWKLLPAAWDEFPDIRRAVRAGCEAANEAQVNLSESPLVLVVGNDDAADAGLGESPLIGDRIRVDHPDLPVHWYGDADGIWVTLPGVSATSLQTRRLARTEGYGEPDEGERLSARTKDLARRRLRFAIQLLRDMRQPVVPVNAVVLMIPYDWMEDDALAQLADAIKIDMREAQQSLGVKCLCQVVFYGIERSHLFGALVDRTPADQRQRRCGCTLPPFSALAEADLAGLHDWLFNFFREKVYDFYTDQHDHDGNGRLYRFLDSFRRGRENFCRLLRFGFAEDISDRFYVGGVYFAAVGRSVNAFVDGVIARLSDAHDDVIGWTENTLRRERRWSLGASLMAAAVVVLVVGNVYLVTRFLW